MKAIRSRQAGGGLLVASRLAVCLVVLGAVLVGVVPTVTAAPQVLPVADSLMDVGATDSFDFERGIMLSVGTVWQITAPDGQFATITRGAQAPTTTTNQKWGLDGTQLAGEVGLWSWEGNLTGHPADGTWTIALRPSPTYDSSGADGNTLTIQGKTIRFGAYAQTAATQVQTWNWRSTSGTWTESSTVPVITGIDTINEAPDEDPNNAVFFQDAPGGGTESPFTAHTLGYTAPSNCNNFANSTVSGAWLGASGTVFSQFIYRDGNFLGTTDLRTVPLYSTTTEENEGAVSNGTDSKSISYNNAVGTSYQFKVRNATSVALGSVQWIPNGLCSNPPEFNTGADVEHDPNALSVSASQAQCAGDPITWALIMQDNPTGLQEHLVELFIFDANQGGFNLPPDPVEVAYYNTTTMHRTGPASEAHSHFVADDLPTGNYVAFAFANYTGIGATDYVDSWAFSVPRGPCTDTPTDLSPVLLAVSSSTTLLNSSINASRAEIVALLVQHMNQTDLMNVTIGQIYEIVSNFTFNVDCSGNNTCQFIVNNDTLNAILQNLTEHRNNTLELNMTSNFNGLGFDGFVLLLFWIAALLFFAYQAWYFSLAFSIPGLFEVLFPADIPGDFTQWFLFCLLGVLMEIAANRFQWGYYRKRTA